MQQKGLSKNDEGLLTTVFTGNNPTWFSDPVPLVDKNFARWLQHFTVHCFSTSIILLWRNPSRVHEIKLNLLTVEKPSDVLSYLTRKWYRFATVWLKSVISFQGSEQKNAPLIVWDRNDSNDDLGCQFYSAILLWVKQSDSENLI